MGNKFLDLFNTKKPVIGMIHLKGNNDEEVFEIAKKLIGSGNLGIGVQIDMRLSGMIRRSLSGRQIL